MPDPSRPSTPGAGQHGDGGFPSHTASTSIQIEHATRRSTAISVWSHSNTMPGNVCSTRTLAPALTPSAPSRSARTVRSRVTRTMRPRIPGASADKARASEVDMKHPQSAVQRRAGTDGHNGDERENREARLDAAFADDHQQIRDAGNEERHDGESHQRLRTGERPVAGHLEHARGAIVTPQEAHHEY